MFVVGEIGVNWDGDFELVKQMMYESKILQLRAVKFQAFTFEMVKDHPESKRLMNSSITKENVEKINEISQEVGIDWFCTPMYPGAVDFLDPFVSRYKIREFDGPRYSFPMETMYATGCCLCIKASDFEKLNRFDNTFTMYCEDVDLSVRAKQGNNKIIYSPESIILHSVSQSLGDNSFEKIRMKLLNQIRLFWKHASGIQLITITLYWIFFYLPGGFLKWIYFKLR